MMKSILCILAVALALIAQATPVTPFQAEQAARAWTQGNAAFAGEDAIDVILAPVAVTNAEGVTLWYRVALNNGSCIVVSPVTELEPVIACLENVPEDGLPSGHPMRAMLERDMADRLRKLGLYAPASTGPALMGASPLSATPADPVMASWAEEGKAKWARLAGGTGGVQLMAAKEKGVAEIDIQMGIVDGFEKGGRFTHWDQGNAGGGRCYNYYTPNHAVCGCVATMMSAIMQYFAVTGGPTGVTGVLPATYNGSDKDTGGNPFVTLGGTYDWGCLTNSDGNVKTTRADYNSLTETQRKLLGHVAYDAGVAIGMSWTDDESGAMTIRVAEAFRKVFGFKDARGVSDPTEDQYAKLIYHQCRAGAPVGLSIHTEGESGGHAVVAVGYGEDEDGVPRTRIFTGWGGTGDGWYALPYINTKSLPSQSGSYLFNVIAGIITMIGYDSDETVPVVGHIDAPGAAIDVPGVPLTMYSNEAGYFGTRVAPGIADCRLLCNGKEAQFEIGAEAALDENVYIIDESDVNGLCDAIPEEIEFVLLNSSVAYTFAKAKAMALAEGKAILRVSGVTGTEPTTNLLAYIYSLDEGNVGDFTNKFVYFFSSAKSVALGDGNPSLGVFLPSETEQDGGWRVENGRLAYGYRHSPPPREITTNDYAYAEDPEASDPAAYAYITNHAYIATWGQYKTEIFGTTNMCYDTVADGLTALTDMAQLVLDEGWAEFCRHTQGITLTVTSPFGEIGTPTPAYGLHENFLYACDDFTAFAPGELVTNKDVGVVLEFRGWTLTNETTGTFQKGTGTNTTPIAVAPGDNLTLTWLTITNAVWIEVVNVDEGMGSTTPESGWHPYGASSLIAMPEDGYKFVGWGFCDYYPSRRAIAPPPEVDRAEQVLTFMATRPMEITAGYDYMNDDEADAFEAALLTTNTLTVVSEPAASEMTNGLENAVLPVMPSVTAVVVHDGSSKTIAMEESVELPAVVVAVSLSSDVVTVVTNAANGDGVKWRCTGWKLGGKTGVGSVAGVTLEGDATLTWEWEKVVLPEGSEEARQPAKIPYADEALETSPLVIYSNANGTLTVEATIGNAVKGWWYVLKTADDLAGPYEKADGADCVKLAAADGELKLSTTFMPTDAKRFYKVTVEEEAP